MKLNKYLLLFFVFVSIFTMQINTQDKTNIQEKLNHQLLKCTQLNDASYYYHIFLKNEIIEILSLPKELSTIIHSYITPESYSSKLLLTLIQKLIEQGAKIDAQDGLGNTILIYAAINHNHELVEWLIKNNADLTIQNNLGRTVEKIIEKKGYHSSGILSTIREAKKAKSEAKSK